jgi:hypothetical protein
MTRSARRVVGKSRETAGPLRAVLRGAVAGGFGTAAMTAWQTLSAKLQGSVEQERPGERSNDPWADAPAPAKVAKRISEAVLGRGVSPELIPLLSNVMHWAYGAGWGAVYGLTVAGRPAAALRRGATFGATVWGSSYLELVPMGIYEPPWKYELQELALDLSYHMAYGLGTAIAFKVLER